MADAKGIEYVYRLCAFLPALGLFAVLLPNIEKAGRTIAASPAVQPESMG